MKKKQVIITVELVAESEDDERMVKELLEWFLEDAIYVPWVKNVEDIVVKEC